MASRFCLISAGFLVLALAFAGCTTVPPTEHPYVPQPLVGKAILPGLPIVRYIQGYDDAAFIADYQLAMRSAQPGPEGVSILAMSGGGPNGAFGAGVLVGWTQAGTRPHFQVVTGVSTGALAAPFAFVGKDYDDRLTRAYTEIRDSDIFTLRIFRSAFKLLNVDALADTKPLDQILATLIDEEMLARIAIEHTRGRRLYVCSHDLVSGRAIYWNLTALAASGRPDSLELFRKALIASASLPIAFPPQYFEVEADGNRYTEMHVDGGLSRQAFTRLNGARAGLPPRPDGTPTPLTVYIIRNGHNLPSYDPIKPTVVNIGLRTMQALATSEGVGDLYRIYSQAQVEQAEFRLMTIPEDFPLKLRPSFDPVYMRELFSVGEKTVKSPQPWATRPPYMSSTDGT